MERKWYHKQEGQLDNLGPAKRWIQSQCGRLWSEVYSKLSVWRKSGNIAISHVVDSHMLGWIKMPGTEHPFYWHHDFFVDDEGILREHKDEDEIVRSRNPRYSYGFFNTSQKQGAVWASERRVIKQGAHLYWGEFTGTILKDGVEVNCYRQDAKLSLEEVEFFEDLTTSAQRDLLY